MRKTFITATLLTLAATALNAQQWGASLSVNNYRWNDSHIADRWGGNLGAKVKYPEGKTLFFAEAELDLMLRRFGPDYYELEDNKFSLLYLHLPVAGGYNFRPLRNKHISIAPKAGFYLSMGLWGNNRNKSTKKEGKKEVKNNWDGVNPFTGFHSLTVDFHDFSRPDVGGLLGANIGIGPHYELHGAYYWGITNGWNNELFNSKSRFYTVGLAYFF